MKTVVFATQLLTVRARSITQHRPYGCRSGSAAPIPLTSETPDRLLACFSFLPVPFPFFFSFIYFFSPIVLLFSFPLSPFPHRFLFPVFFSFSLTSMLPLLPLSSFLPRLSLFCYLLFFFCFFAPYQATFPTPLLSLLSFFILS